ncbi:DUF6516 family protein [Acidithiobacillus sp. IBUN Pt1247-S3]|uniref:toxin-antitoxin system TumE family protein n=1 Tax=Acidithiobacillus sp. IBUN Pt1247-S3 TaxID=3166642 RepID=UPI0034E41C6D
MESKELMRRRVSVQDNAFAEMVLWQLECPVPPCDHPYKYRLALIVQGQCVVRYDNERGKGDHRHIDMTEKPYVFSTAEQLVADFFHDARRWLDEHGHD